MPGAADEVTSRCLCDNGAPILQKSVFTLAVASCFTFVTQAQAQDLPSKETDSGNSRDIVVIGS